MPVVSDLYYYAYQQGQDAEVMPLVLLHGAGGNHLHWPPEVRRMPGCRIYAPDLPGHGRSGGCGQQSLNAYARLIIEWLDAIEIHQAAFAGHSMGGGIALTLALHYPQRVAALGLIGTGARLRVHPDTLARSASPTTFHKAVDTILAGAFSPQADPRLVELAGARMLEIRPTVLHGDLLACDSFDILERVGEIRKPALVVCGADDQMAPLRYSQYLAGAIPGAALKVIPDAGHMVQLEKPLEVADALHSFFSQLPYQTGRPT